MPLINEAYWVKRFGAASPCWSGDRWLDLEHGVVSRLAFRRVFPSLVLFRVLDVGCGDGRWSQWMARTFDAEVLGTDALAWPGVEKNVAFEFTDAQALDKNERVADFDAELVVFMNSLTCMADWKEAVASAVRLDPEYVLAFDNFQHPTPPWWKNLPHRKPITCFELIAECYGRGYELDRWVGADVFHRRLFLATPRWLHPMVSIISMALDVGAAYVLPPHRARHMALLFRKRKL